MSLDARGWRMALVPDALINPPAGSAALPDALPILQAHGYGVLQLPPSGNYGPLLAVIADQVAEYSHHGYAVVAIGLHGTAGGGLHWRRLAPLLRHREVALPPRHLIRPGAGVDAEAQRLGAFLAAYDVPVEEQRRWRR
ncbi:MAG TPA: hypothetical protein VMT66_10730 [Steroidobacteraceae bacterium]|nr:hypothetical protein [Steroidobacteraceae bacterium]